MLSFISSSMILFGNDAFDRGVEAYRLSNFAEAQSALEEALGVDPSNDSIHLLLAMVKQKQGDYNGAEAILLQAKNLVGPHFDDVRYNLANLYLAMGDHQRAVDLYSQQLEGPFASQVRLNRANAYMGLEQYPLAVQDYQQYLNLDPGSSQRSQIEQLIALLQQRLANEEEMRRRAEEQARLEEEARLAAERAAAEEAARQQALLDEILSALDGSGSDTEVFSAGSETIETQSEESDIMD